MGDGCMDRWTSRGERQLCPESTEPSQAWTWTLGRGLALDLPSSDHRRARETNSFLLAARSPQGTTCLPAPAPAWPPDLCLDLPARTSRSSPTPQRHILSTLRLPCGGKHHLNSAGDSKSPRDAQPSDRGASTSPQQPSDRGASPSSQHHKPPFWKPSPHAG